MCCVLWSVYCVLCAVRCAKLPHIPVSNTHSQQPTHPQRCGEKGGEGEGGERRGQCVRECVCACAGGEASGSAAAAAAVELPAQRSPHLAVSNSHDQQPTHPLWCGQKGGEGEGGEREGQCVRECVCARAGGEASGSAAAAAVELPAH